MAESSSAAGPSLEKKTITVKSSDGEEFVVDEAAALLSQTIKHIVEDDCANMTIPLPNVTSKALSKVIEYCNMHVDGKVEDDSIKTFDKDFVNVDEEMLFELILAANYLDIKGLLDLTCQAVADFIKDKSVEQVRKIFNITNDYTPAEEAEVRRENAWAFED